MITIETHLDDRDADVIAKFSVERMADAVGCEPHERSSFPGFIYELDSCCLAVAPFTDIANDLAPHELEALTNDAAEKHTGK